MSDLRARLLDAIGRTDASEGLPHWHTVSDTPDGQPRHSVYVERQAVIDAIEAALATTPEPREDGWEERLLVLLENEGVVTWGDEGHRARFLAIVDSLAAARGEPDLTGIDCDCAERHRAHRLPPEPGDKS